MMKYKVVRRTEEGLVSLWMLGKMKVNYQEGEKSKTLSDSSVGLFVCEDLKDAVKCQKDYCHRANPLYKIEIYECLVEDKMPNWFDCETWRFVTLTRRVD